MNGKTQGVPITLHDERGILGCMVPEWVTGDVPRWCAVAELPNFPEFAGYLYKFGDDYNVAHWPLWVGNDNVSRPDEARFKRKS